MGGKSRKTGGVSKKLTQSLMKHWEKKGIKPLSGGEGKGEKKKNQQEEEKNVGLGF